MQLPAFVSDLSLSPLDYHRQLLAWTRGMREEAPIIWDEASSDWLVFRYEDVLRVQSDYRVFSSENTVPGRAVDPGRTPSIIELDPPRHQQLRVLVTQAFSPRVVATMAPRIEQMVDVLLDGMLARRSGDWMVDLANPLPMMVIVTLLGFPVEDWTMFKALSDAMMGHNTDQQLARREMAQAFVQAIALRRQQPGEDLISLLLASEVEGERLGVGDVVAFCFTLLLAGNVTTTNVLGNALLCFDLYPAEMERLRQQPALLPAAIEEIIRYMPPFRASPGSLIEGRIAQEDVLLCGQLVRKGERVRVDRLSANFDERYFTAPERFDIGRTPNRHQSFGHGVHFCLGAPLARLETQIVFERVLKRLPELRIVAGQSLQQTPSLGIFGVQNLLVTF